MNEQLLKYLYDIENSINSVEEFIGDNSSFDNYLKNRMLKRAVERECEIIGEALNKILKIDPDIEISDKNKIIALRNRVMHGYDTVDDSIIWGVVKKYFPILKSEVSKLLARN